MSKRSEEAACKYTGLQHPPTDDCGLLTATNYYTFLDGYEQAEKDIIERDIKWLKEHWREYVWTTDNSIPHFGHWERDFRKAMEEEL